MGDVIKGLVDRMALHANVVRDIAAHRQIALGQAP